MILGASEPFHALPGARATLDDLFRRAGVRRPDALALADPPNRNAVIDGPPRRLTYAEADRAVTAIAGRLQRLGLAPDSVVGLQLPHTVDSVLALLGVLRAGMIAAPLPLLWGRAEAAAGLGRLGAKVLIAGGRTGTADHAELAMQVAADVFPIRYVCGFGANLPDGMIPLDDLVADPGRDPVPARRGGDGSGHAAVVTWDVTPEGLVAVPRNHMELIAGGLAILLEGRLPENAVILSTCPGGSFAGLALGVLPWLLTGGTLVLHQPFDPAVFARQCADEGCDTVVLPGPLVPRLFDAGLLAQPDLRRVLGLWRAPERAAASPAWRHESAALIDVLTFGEVGLLGLRRGEDGRSVPLPLGPVLAPRGAEGAAVVAETARTPTGTLALRGPAVTRAAYPPDAERSGGPRLSVDAGGFVDTGFACRADVEGKTASLTAPPPGIVGVGGYRFLLRDLQTATAEAGAGAGIAALPDQLGGHRLAGQAQDRAAVRAALADAGRNPLVADAFAERGNPDAA